MKYIIASDIHGSSYYCKKLVDAINKYNPDKIILLGDILYHGPRNDLPKDYSPKQVIELLNPLSEKILCVQGNCDAEVDQMVLNFPIKPNYIELKHANRMFIITHGHHININSMIEHEKDTILLHGHTHVPALKQLNDYTYVNPGSTSIPKENSWNGYIYMDEEKINWLDFDNNLHMEFKL